MPNNPNPNPFGLLFQAPLWRPGQATSPDPFKADEDAERAERIKRAARNRPQRQHGTPFNLPPQPAAVMSLLCDGHTVKEIAQQLELSIKTVETHIERALLRIGARNRMQAAVLFDREARKRE